MSARTGALASPSLEAGVRLDAPLAWLLDEAVGSSGPDRFLAELGRRLLAEGVPLLGGTLTLAVPHPIIARRTWMWRADTAVVIEGLSFAADPSSQGARDWLAGFGTVHQDTIGSQPDAPMLGWASSRPLAPATIERLRHVARFAAAPLAALAARATLSTLLEAYLGRRSARRVLDGALRRGMGETIRAALVCADLRDFTALSEASEPTLMIAALDAWFDRVAGAIHPFGGEILKFMGDGVLAIFPAADALSASCDAALRAVTAARAGMAHLDQTRRAQGLPPLHFGAAVHVGEILWGNVGAVDRLDFTAIGPAVNLVSRLEGLCRPLNRSVLVSGAVAAETSLTLEPLGKHRLRGIAEPCAIYTLPDA